MSKRSIGLAAAILVAGAVAAGCTSQTSSPPFAGRAPQLDTASKRHGEVLFMRNCNQCHPGGAGGLGPALNNKPAPAAAIKLVIRVGPGEMPSFGESFMSDGEVDAVADYVVALREADDDNGAARQD